MLLLMLLAVPLVAGGLLWYRLPAFVEARAREALGRLGTLLDAEITVASVTVEGLHTIRLQDLVIRPRSGLAGEAPLLRIPAIEVRLADVAVFEGRARLDEVRLTAPVLTVLRRFDGSDAHADILAHLRDLLEGRAGRGAPGDGGLFKHLERRLPRLWVEGGQVVVTDDSRDGSLLPAGLPRTLRAGELRVTAQSTSERLDELVLEVVAEGRLDPIGVPGKVTLHYDRRLHRLSLAARTLAPVATVVDGRRLRAERVAWTTGQPLTLRGVSLDDTLSIEAVTLWLASAPAGGLLSARIRRLELLRPTLSLAADGTAPTWLGLRDPGRRHVPAAEGTASPPGAKRPPKRPPGQAVRDRVAAMVRRLGEALGRASSRVQRFGQNVPFPELAIRLGRVLAPGDGSSPWRALDRFNLEVRRPDSETFQLDLTLPGPTDGAPKGTVMVRAHLLTGDLQVTLKADGVDLRPLETFLPSGVRAPPGAQLVDTDLRLVYATAGRRLEVSGRWGVRRLAWQAPSIASEPLEGVDLGGRVQARFELERGAISITDSTLRLGNVPLSVSLTARDLHDAPALEWTLQTEGHVRTQAIVDALPAALLGELRGLQMGGELSWRQVGGLDMRDMRTLHYTTRLDTRMLAVQSLGGRVSFQRVTAPFVHRAIGKGGRVHEMRTGPGATGWVPYGRISPWMAHVLTTTEDGTFWRHQGMAFFAIKDAAVANLESGRFIRGASTITQQLVTNLFLTPETTLSRKLQELFLAWRIERFLDKKRILELYLNVVEFGPGIYGIGRAARHYFGKAPADLDVVECAFLGLMLPSPRRYYYQFKRGEVTDSWRKSIERTLQTMHKRKKLTAEELAGAAPYSPRFAKNK